MNVRIRLPDDIILSTLCLLLVYWIHRGAFVKLKIRRKAGIYSDKKIISLRFLCIRILLLPV